MQKKHARDGRTPDGKRLNFSGLTIGRRENERNEKGRRVQREALKGFFITRTGEVVQPIVGSRLRTATRDGRAAEGQLFGYAHIESDTQPRYVATIEADDILDPDWDLLCSAFDDNKTLRLGRASATFYGGAYECEVRRKDIPEIWPTVALPTHATRVRVWALSDLALADTFGAPCFVPTTKMFGLPDGGEFCGSDSAISVRRYCPWNRKLMSRDIERQVIDAGSVITFTYKTPPAEPGNQPTGETEIDVPAITIDGSQKARPATSASDDDPLVRWLQGKKSVRAQS
jgi:hypothetical protein